jgi:hypothetical protein
MKTFPFIGKENHIKVERDIRTGDVVSVSYDGLVLPFEDKFVHSVTESFVKQHDYKSEGKIKHPTNEDFNNHAILGIVFAEASVHER